MILNIFDMYQSIAVLILTEDRVVLYLSDGILYKLLEFFYHDSRFDTFDSFLAFQYDKVFQAHLKNGQEL